MLNQRQQDMLLYLVQQKEMTVADIKNNLGFDVSRATIKRDLSELVEQNIVSLADHGRNSFYYLELAQRVFLPVTREQYHAIEVGNRSGGEQFNFDLFPNVPALFSDEERSVLDKLTTTYLQASQDLSKVLHKKELERFVIELSWKSSVIEGNTYTLVDTAVLIEQGVLSDKYQPQETEMILNHKKAFEYVLESKERLKQGVSISYIEDLHRVLVTGLGVKPGLRPVGVRIAGSNYLPLDNIYQIQDALNQLIEAVNRQTDGYTKALLMLVGISYIQPFEDGNKRTARLMANALLIAHDLSPLSYRDVDVARYRESMLLWYEQNVITAMKEIFTEQYEFAATHYRAVDRPVGG